MKTHFTTHRSNQAGSALMLAMIMTAAALVILAGVMTWGSSSTRLTHRSIQYTRSVAAAEAATEKAVSQITRDFLFGNENLVVGNLNVYRQNTVPTSADSPYWSTWEFNDALGNIGRTYVERTPGSSYVVLDSTYAGLKGNVATYTVVSHARDTASVQDVIAGVSEQLQLTTIPVFQFGMFSSGNMEISCGQPFDMTGRVHANQTLYVEPDSSLTFESSVTAVVDILFQRHPLDPRGLTPNGGVVYIHPEEKVSPVDAMTLPIGTTNTPEAVREIIEPPTDPLESPNSPIGLLRYYNNCDMVLTVSNTGISATSGYRIDGFRTSITNTDLQKFVSTTNSFTDAREGKTILPIDIDIGSLKIWIETNLILNTVLRGVKGPLYTNNSIYVDDRRTLLPGLGAVRVWNGRQLPANGLTVATGRPLYVWGHYNQPNDAYLATTNTTTTEPASLVADAITVLSTNWLDANSVTEPGAAPTTVNAAFLTGVVETTAVAYSGGMENFPRFLEAWGQANAFTYNGSMVKMFPSLYAIGVWGHSGVYDPPKRDWAYDSSFDDSLKLPPLTPSYLKVITGKWVTVAPGSNVAPTP